MKAMNHSSNKMPVAAVYFWMVLCVSVQKEAEDKL